MGEGGTFEEEQLCFVEGAGHEYALVNYSTVRTHLYLYLYVHLAYTLHGFTVVSDCVLVERSR